MRALRQLQELRSRYLALRTDQIRVPITIGGCIPIADDPEQVRRVMIIPRYTIHGGLPILVFDDDWGHEAASGDCIA
jgi:hypothetical protein